MQKKAGIAELRLDVEAPALLPGRHEAQHVGVGPQALMVPRLTQAPRTVAAVAEPLHGTLNCILTPVKKTQNLWRKSYFSGLQLDTGNYYIEKKNIVYISCLNKIYFLTLVDMLLDLNHSLQYVISELCNSVTLHYYTDINCLHYQKPVCRRIKKMYST